MLERDTLFFSQRMALLFGALMGPAAELLPGTAAQAGGVGTAGVLAAAVAMVLAGSLMGRLALQEGGLAQGVAEPFGKWGGRGILLIYMVWFQLQLTLRLRLTAQRLMAGGERDGSAWFFVFALGAVCLWMAHGRLGSLGRSAQLFFLALAITGAVVLVLALTQTQRGNLLPQETLREVGAAAVLIPGINTLGYGLFAGFLIQKGWGRKEMRRWIRWAMTAGLALAVMQMIVIGCYGVRLTSRLPYPFFQLAKSVGVAGAFQRVESIVSAIWVLSDLLLLLGILWCMRRIGAVLCPRAVAEEVVTIAVLLAVVGSLALFGEKIPPRHLERLFLPAGSLILGIAIPALAILIKGVKGRR